MAPNIPDKELLAKMVCGEEMPTSEVVGLLASHDTLVKKITCYHVADQCTTNSDLALLTANLLLRDATDANPSIRSASITALAALPGIEESSVRAITSALSDQSALVRRSGAVACVRLHKHSPEAVLECGLINALYEGLRDSDPIVITNCILALDSILKKEGGIVINKNITHYLMGRILQFSDCNAVYILTLLLRYTPKSEEELFLLLNSLDEILVSKAPAVLVASVKLFLHWTKDLEHLKKDLLDLIQPSVCKILGRNIPETSYLLLECLQTLGDIKEVYGPHYKYFLVRSKDPGYLKTQKLKILPLVSTEANVCCLIEEVKPFCSDYQSFREAVICLGALGMVSPNASKMCRSTLESLLDAPTERLVVAALECLLTIISPNLEAKPKKEEELKENQNSQNSSEEKSNTKIRRMLPELPDSLLAAVTRAISRPSVQEAEPTLIIHILGTLAAYLDSATDIFESMSSLVSTSTSVHADLVTCAARIFIARPAEAQLLLSAVLSKALKTPGVPAARAALVYAALMEGPDKAAFLLSAYTLPHKLMGEEKIDNEVVGKCTDP